MTDPDATRLGDMTRFGLVRSVRELSTRQLQDLVVEITDHLFNVPNSLWVDFDRAVSDDAVNGVRAAVRRFLKPTRPETHGD